MRHVNHSADRGSAAVEFIALATVLLVPVVYLVLTIGSLQSGALAAEGAARQAARIWAASASVTGREAAAARAVDIATRDFGFEPGRVHWTRSCPDSCSAPGSTVTVRVSIDVPLPLIPPVLDLPERATIRVNAEASQPISRFGVRP